jgi:hypothetical protein
VKGGSGGRGSAVCVITPPTVWLEMAGACLMVIENLPVRASVSFCAE